MIQDYKKELDYRLVEYENIRELAIEGSQSYKSLDVYDDIIERCDQQICEIFYKIKLLEAVHE